MKSVRGTAGRAARFFRLESWFRLLLLCVLVGIVAGLGAVAFEFGIRFMEKEVLNPWLFTTDPGFASIRDWALVLVPALGGAIVGILVMWLAPEAAGHGTDSVIRAFHREKGIIRARVPVVKAICSVITIGTGGSAGKEGPIAQMGAGFGSSLASLLKLSVRDRRLLMMAGVAGGIGAIFKAPLGGALFAAEVLYREPDFESDAVIPGVISSVTAYSVFAAFTGYERILQIKQQTEAGPPIDMPPLTFPSHGGGPAELFHYAVLSLICAMVAFLFAHSFHAIERAFSKLPVKRWIRPALGGAMLGVLALALIHSIGHLSPLPQEIGGSKPEHVMSGGYAYLQTIVNGALDRTHLHPTESLELAGFLGVIVLARIVATSMTIGSGGSGGVLFPSLFLGGVSGAAYSKFCRALRDAGWMPDYMALTPEARASMVLVGMGGVFAACTKTPIASLVMVSEITGSYGLVVPLMLTCASAYILSHSFGINSEQVPGIADSPAHRGDFLINVLEDISVSDAIGKPEKPETIAANMPLNKILERIKGSTATVFPVVDEGGYLVGIFSLSDVRRIINEGAVGNLIVAGDLGTTEVATVTADTNLDEALRLFTQKNVDQLPVVATGEADTSKTSISKVVRKPHGPVGTHRVIAMFSRRDLISAYHRHLHALRAADAQEDAGSQIFDDALSNPVLHEAPLDIDDLVRTPLPSEPVAESTTPTNPNVDLLDDPPEDKRQ